MKHNFFKLLFTLALGVLCTNTYAQFTIEPKINLAMAAITVFNPAVEIGFGEHSAVQLEYFGAYSKYNYMGSGAPFIMNLSMVEYRRYLLNKEHKGLFAGANFGTHMYKMSKNIIPLIEHQPGDTSYDWGFGVVLGLHVGYKFILRERLGLELSAAGGWQRSMHEPYNSDGTLQVEMNASGEWFPYKLGVTLSYKFGQL